jgi:hypothetical protein
MLLRLGKSLAFVSNPPGTFGDARQVLVNGRLEYTKKTSPVSLWRAIFLRCRRQKDCAGILEDTGRFCVDACVHASSPFVMS